MPRPARPSFSITLLALAIATAFTADAEPVDVEFDDLVRNPADFEGRTVSVKGVAEDGGDRIGIYRDVEARRRVDLRKFFLAYLRRDAPNYPGTNMGHYVYANAHWVKVTGVVDRRLRGRFGDEPFGLRLKKLAVLPGDRLMEFVCVQAVILNESSGPIKVDLERDDGGSMFSIGPGEPAGEACMGSDPKTAQVKVALPSGRTLVHRPLADSEARDYYHSKRDYLVDTRWPSCILVSCFVYFFPFCRAFTAAFLSASRTGFGKRERSNSLSVIS